MKVVVVAGTGTDVGKTHVTCALVAALRARGSRVVAWKPVASGVTGECEDARRHADALEASYVAPAYALRRPVSPHLAAREEGAFIDVDHIARRARSLAEGADVLVVETAGGLFSPLAPSRTNADVVRALSGEGAEGTEVELVLVAPDRLGVLHDVAAAQIAAHAEGLPAPLVVLSAPERADVATGTNASELAAVGRGEVCAVFPRASVDDDETRAAASALADAIVRTRPS